MSLLLDALKRAEEAKRAKVEPVDASPQAVETSRETRATHTSPPAPTSAPSASTIDAAELGQITQPAKATQAAQESQTLPKASASISPSVSRNTTSVKPLSLSLSLSSESDSLNDSVPETPLANKRGALSVAEMELASLLQQSITDGDGTNTSPTVLPTLSPATAAFRAARSQASAAALGLDPMHAVPPLAPTTAKASEATEISPQGEVSAASPLTNPTASTTSRVSKASGASDASTAFKVVSEQSTDLDRNYAQDIVHSATSSRQQAQRDQVNNAFNVKKTSQQSASLKWLAPAVALLVFIVGAASWYVWQEINRNSRPGISTPPMATGTPSSPDAKAASNNTGASPNAMSPTPSPTFAPNTGVINTPAGATSTAAANPQNTISADAAALRDAAEAKTANNSLPPLLPPPALAVVQAVPSPVKTKSRVADIPLTLRESFAKQVDALPLSPSRSQSLVKLRSSDAGANKAAVIGLNPALSQAYAALSRGSYDEAIEFYAQAIAAQPANIDANLGFATAAARAGKTEMANRFYRRVLELDPRNATAAAALLSLASTSTSSPNNNNKAATNSLAEASELQRLIDQDPTSAASHFALGNLFATERRWLEAQQAFFAAARLAPQNPDYLYNLAVSLDNLGQTKPAADFYRRALAAVSVKSRAQFQIEVIEKRLAVATHDPAASASNSSSTARQASPSLP